MSIWVAALICGLCMQYGDLRTRIISLHGSQTSSADLCKQNSLISTRITSLFGSQPSCVFFFCIQKSDFMTRINCLCFSQEYQDYIGSSSHLWFCAWKTSTLGPELQVSMGPRSHLWFLHAKQRILDKNITSLWVPDMTYRFVHVQQHA